MSIAVEFVFATAADQMLVQLQVPDGSTIADVIDASGVRDRFPDENLDALKAGVWGKFRKRNDGVRDGDRVEVYRELLIDPRDARRERATE